MEKRLQEMGRGLVRSLKVLKTREGKPLDVTKPDDYYAHTLPGKPPSEWQPLEDHLNNIAELARSFAKPFGAEEWAYLAGLWHDLGKAQ